MRAEDIRDLLQKRPFQPFRIYLTDGKSYDITHPEICFLLQSRLDIGVAADPKTGIPDHSESAALFHIVRIEELKREPSQSRN